MIHHLPTGGDEVSPLALPNIEYGLPYLAIIPCLRPRTNTPSLSAPVILPRLSTLAVRYVCSIPSCLGTSHFVSCRSLPSLFHFARSVGVAHSQPTTWHDTDRSDRSEGRLGPQAPHEPCCYRLRRVKTCLRRVRPQAPCNCCRHYVTNVHSCRPRVCTTTVC